MANGVQVGEAFVRIRPDTRGFQEQLTRDAQQAGRSASQVLGNVLTGAAFVAGARKIIDAASGLEQAVGGTRAVFGESAAAVEDFASRAADAAGLSERAAREATSTIGAMLQGFGFTRDEAARWSVQLTQLGADLAATFGGTPEQAVQALGAALRGEFDPLERFGVSLNVTQANLKAVELGLAESTSEVDLNARAQAALAIIMERSSAAQGQFAREANTAAGQMERAKANFEDTAAAIGEGLLPAVSVVEDLLGGVARGFGELPGPVQSAAVAMVALGVAANRLGVRDLATLRQALQRMPVAATAAAGGLAAALYAFDQLRKQQEEARRAAEELSEKIREKIDTGSYEEVRAQYDRLVAGIRSVDEEVDRLPWWSAAERNNLIEYRNGLANTASEFAVFINRVDELARAAGISGNESINFLRRLDELGVQTDSTATALLFYNSGLNETEIAALAAARATNDGGKALESYADEIKEVFSATEDMESANRDVADAQRELNDLSDEAADLARDRRQAELDLIDAQERLLDLQDRAAENDRSRRGAALDVRQAELDLKKAREEAAEAGLDPDERERAALRVEQAELRLEEAHARVADVEEEISDQSRELERARLDVQSAEDRLREVREQQLDLPRRQAEAEDELTRALINQQVARIQLAALLGAEPDLIQRGIDTIEQWRDQGILTGKQADDLRFQLFALGLQAQQVDDEITTKVSAPGIEQALANFQQLSDTLFRVGESLAFIRENGKGIVIKGPGIGQDVDLSFLLGQTPGGQTGGHARAGQPFEVLESGEPELLTTQSGRQFLLTPEGGVVTPNVRFGAAGGDTYNITVNGSASEHDADAVIRALRKQQYLAGRR